METRAARLRLPVKKKPTFVQIAPRVGLGYRKNQGAGTWLARGADGKGGYWQKVFALADDQEDADGVAVLTYYQAQDRAKELVRGTAKGEKPVTVEEALDGYEADLLRRGNDTSNSDRVRHSLTTDLANKTVALLTSKDLSKWRDGLIAKGLKPASADRTARMLKAALNLAGREDQRIVNGNSWRTALSKLPEDEPPVCRVISDADVQRIVTAAHGLSVSLGLFIETAAVTGSRPSQLRKLEVGDVLAAGLSMPSSRKGRKRRVTRQSLPIPTSLAAALKSYAKGRVSSSPLFLRENGRPRVADDYAHQWRGIANSLGLADGVTLYALRHSSIVRQLIRSVPVRIVAAHHDTSVAMIEHTYSRYISQFSETMIRGSLIEFSR